MGQSFINFFLWVDIHGIYYRVKMVTKYDDLFTLKNIPFLIELMLKSTKQITTKMKMTKNIKNIYDQWLCICRKNIII